MKLNRDNVDISYPPIVQSGGVYDLRPSAANDERPLQYDVVLLAIGARALHAWLHARLRVHVRPMLGCEVVLLAIGAHALLHALLWVLVRPMLGFAMVKGMHWARGGPHTAVLQVAMLVMMRRCSRQRRGFPGAASWCLFAQVSLECHSWQ